MKSKILKRPLLLVVCIIPAILTGLFIAKYGVNVPYWDQWNTPVEQLLSASQGELTFDNLFKQHNESRKFFPKLFFLGLASLGGWHVKLEMFCTLCLVGLISLGLLTLSRKTLKTSIDNDLVMLAFSNCLLFSTTQWENWLWGIQLITFVPIACILLSLIVINSKFKVSLRFFGCGLLATIATFSFANGLLAWIVLIPSFIFSIYDDHHRKWRFLFGWLVWSFTTAIVYFFDYVKPSHHPGFDEAVLQPLTSAFFFLAFLGAPFGFHNLVAAAMFGFILVVLFAFYSFYILRKFLYIRDVELFRKGLPWFTLGSYSLLSGLLTTAGRVGLSLEASLQSRYVTFSSFLPIALIYGLGLILFLNSPPTHFFKQIKRVMVSCLASIFSVGYVMSYAQAIEASTITYKNRKFAKACLMLINIVQETDCVARGNTLHPMPELVKERSILLDDLGILRPPLEDESILNNFHILEVEGSHGFFDTFSLDSQGNFLAAGWAFLLDANWPADAVLLTYTTDDNVRHLLQIVKVDVLRPDVAAAIKNVGHSAGWEAVIPAGQLPPKMTKVEAWAFNVDIKTAYKLANEHTVN